MMMTLPFPHIEHIDDVLPHLKGYPEFGVNTKGDYIVIQYNVEKPTTFDIDEQDPLPGLIRRECRGILFDGVTHKVISRPFHKFFGLNQREETQSHNVDLSQPHTIHEKLDGSLIRLFSTSTQPDLIRFGTKRGETDIAADAERFARSHHDRDFFDWVKILIEHNLTPIFEWTSPNNRIVLPYEKEALSLLAIRHNYTGEYIDLDNTPIPDEVPRPDVYPNTPNISDLIDSISNLQGKEGVVLYFPQHKRFVKLKSHEYVSIHKAKELVSQNRHVVLLALEGKLDDVIGLLPQSEHDRINKIHNDLFDGMWNRSAELMKLFEHLIVHYYDGTEFDRKGIWTEVLPKVDSPDVSALVGIILNKARVANVSPIDLCEEAMTDWTKKKAQTFSEKAWRAFDEEFLKRSINLS